MTAHALKVVGPAARSPARQALAEAIEGIAAADATASGVKAALERAEGLERTERASLARLEAVSRQAGADLAEVLKAGILAGHAQTATVTVDSERATDFAEGRLRLASIEAAKVTLAADLDAAERAVVNAQGALDDATQAVLVEDVDGLVQEGLTALATLKRVQRELGGADMAGSHARRVMPGAPPPTDFSPWSGNFSQFPFPQAGRTILRAVEPPNVRQYETTRWAAYRAALRADPDAIVEPAPEIASA